MEKRSFGKRRYSTSSKVSKVRTGISGKIEFYGTCTGKEVREKILINTPVPSNLKFSQKLDEYMQELQQDGKKTKTLSFEKRIMEEKRELIPADEQV